MAEVNHHVFTFKEVVEALLKKENIHEGIWGIYVEFGLGSGNAGPSDNELFPTAFIPIRTLGIQRVEKENSLSVDAAKVTPPTPSTAT